MSNCPANHNIWHPLEPTYEVWRTDLDFLVPHNDRLLVLAAANVTITPPSTPYSHHPAPALPLTGLPQSLPQQTLTTGQGDTQVNTKEPGRTRRDVGTSSTKSPPWSRNTQQGMSPRGTNPQRDTTTNRNGGQRTRPGRMGQRGSGRTTKKEDSSKQGGGNGSTNKKSSGISVKSKDKDSIGLLVKSSGEEELETTTSVTPEWRTYAGLGGKAVGVEKKETGEVVRPEEETVDGDNKGAGYAKLPEDGQWSPLSPELINYTIALIVFAIRYPSVFWHTNKAFGLIFSLQLVLNGIHTILLITAFTILYKLHVCGASGLLHGGESFLLDLPTSVGLVVASVVLLTCSSSCLYFYGYHKFAEFVCRSRQRYHIMLEEEPCGGGSGWWWCVQVGGLGAVAGLGVCQGPVLWDLCMVYRGSLDALILAAVVGTVLHLALWAALWLTLTLKTSWTFKLRVTVGRACVASARSIKLVNDVELATSACPTPPSSNPPLLVVGAGKAYAITDSAPKKSIMSVVQKSHQEKRARGQAEEIYWLRPSKPLLHGASHLEHTKPASPRVTFEEDAGLPSSRKSRPAKSLKASRDSTYQRVTTLSDSDDEAGDYAMLRESEQEPSSTAQQVRQQGHGGDPRYVDRQQILAYHRALGESVSAPTWPSHQVPDYEETDHLHLRSPQPAHLLDTQGPLTPRSTRSNDSGVAAEDHRSQSPSTSSSSNTPPDHSEESGVHSGATDNPRNRSNSVDDLTQLPHDPGQVMSPRANQPPTSGRPPAPHNSSSPGSPYKSGRTVSPVPGSILYPVSESTVVIRRQRNLTREIKPPVDPIYGTRPLTSFTEHPSHDPKRRVGEEDLLAVSQNNFNSSQSSSGYHSSSGGNSTPRSSPIPLSNPHPISHTHPGRSHSPAHHHPGTSHSPAHHQHHSGLSHSPAHYHPGPSNSPSHIQHPPSSNSPAHQRPISSQSPAHHQHTSGPSNTPAQHQYPSPSHSPAHNNISDSSSSNHGTQQQQNFPHTHHAPLSISTHPIYGHKMPGGGIHGIYGQLGRMGPRVSGVGGPNNPQSSIYGHTTNPATSNGPPSKLPQAPQIPLPPIPQGAVHQSSLQDIYGRTTGPKIYGEIGEMGGVYGSAGPVASGMRQPVGRSASLRVASGGGGGMVAGGGALGGSVTRHNIANTGSFSHLPRESNYNTNV
ncbi:hypothetical protein Pmani_010420 [Petrolisthes manimaculis]|uniref:Protein tincar n=1 Tax=Petrolisthes manimaculis TaxID=1843537 RepID=A0AAE1Q1H4_9EUCA|nr:hypothetical protein Pmani_010420 [Petrolisthes manimaculis]